MKRIEKVLCTMRINDPHRTLFMEELTFLQNNHVFKSNTVEKALSTLLGKPITYPTYDELERVNELLQIRYRMSSKEFVEYQKEYNFSATYLRIWVIICNTFNIK